MKVGLGQTSVYHPLPGLDALWSEISIYGSATTRLQYGMFGDTIINSYTYHKIYQRTIICWDTTMTTGNSDLVGALREDSLKRVYFHPLNSSFGSCSTDSVYKIYDFSKETPGDTIQFFSASMGCYAREYLTIDYVDSILINGTYRKLFHFIEGETWIEGIGSTRSLLSAITAIPTCSCTNALLCHKENDTLVYINPTYNFCYCSLGVNIHNEEKQNKIKVSPNPFSVLTTLNTNENLTGAILTVYNSNGQQVKKTEHISGNKITLHRDNLPSGLYFLLLTKDNKIFSSERLIIADK
jgi:hypothetical protein